DVCDECGEGYDLFTDIEAVEREKARERAVLELADRYGKNAVLRGMNLLEGATQRERNEMIGGHRAGYDDAAGAS
ncbi:MAG: DNA repair protein, partial [Oscillospiraceae bacterium]|nr:DNA repair protein [Oscillospiraceae bacterium]